MTDQETKDREQAERENAERERVKRESESDAAGDTSKKERRPTVVVTCGLQNGVQIRRHTPGLEDRAPLMPSGQGYELKNGDTGGIDKEWFMGWLDENPGLSLVTSGMITWRDEEPPAEEEGANDPIQSRLGNDRTSEADEATNKDNRFVSSGITDGPGNPERGNAPAQPKSSTIDPDDHKDEVQDPRVKNTDGLTDMTDTDPSKNANK